MHYYIMIECKCKPKQYAEALEVVFFYIVLIFSFNNAGIYADQKIVSL